MGYIRAGEWLAFQIAVPQADRYQILAAIATDGYPGSADIQFDGVTVGTIEFLDTGEWDNFQEWTLPGWHYFEAGEHELKILANTSLFDIDYLELRVPEPATVALLGLGGLTALLRHRRRRG